MTEKILAVLTALNIGLLGACICLDVINHRLRRILDRPPPRCPDGSRDPETLS